MHLVTIPGKAQRERGTEAQTLGGMAGIMVRGWRWWRAHAHERQLRTAKKQLFLLETMVLGPKQRVVLMRCGSERFLVGMGAEGVTSVVRVQEVSPVSGAMRGGAEPLEAGGDGPWGG